jgi:hypothetical protein
MKRAWCRFLNFESRLGTFEVENQLMDSWLVSLMIIFDFWWFLVAGKGDF